jgi:O-antigen/teichoic acid export membrane protein
MGILDNNTIGQIWKMRYYTAALVFQKGVPIIIIPFILTVFSPLEYANYVLLYSAVQIIGTIIGMGVPTAFVSFWRHDKDVNQLAAQSIRFLTVRMFWYFCVSFITLLFFNPIVFDHYRAFDLFVITMTFIVIYNVNLIALGFSRSTNREKQYLLASISGAVAIVFGVFLSKYFLSSNLIGLVSIQIFSLLLASLILFGRNIIGVISRITRDDRSLNTLFRSARPLAVNSLILLVVMNVDKWFAKLFFSGFIFTQYVIDYQAAFAMMFVPAAIGTYLTPRIRSYVLNSDTVELRRDIFSSRILTLVGSVLIAISMYFYARFANLVLSEYYWILICALLIEGQNSITSLQFMVRQRFSNLLFITMFGLIIYGFALAAAGTLQSTTLLYLSLLINALVMPALLCQGAYRRRLLGSAEPSRDSHDIKLTGEES